MGKPRDRHTPPKRKRRLRHPGGGAAQHSNTCPSKKSYATEEAALKAAAKVNENRPPYICACGNWHLGKIAKPAPPRPMPLHGFPPRPTTEEF